MLTQHVFARGNPLARWDLAHPTRWDEAIAAVVETDNPPGPVLALILGKPEEKD